VVSIECHVLAVLCGSLFQSAALWPLCRSQQSREARRGSERGRGGGGRRERERSAELPASRPTEWSIGGVRCGSRLLPRFRSGPSSPAAAAELHENPVADGEDEASWLTRSLVFQHLCAAEPTPHKCSGMATAEERRALAEDEEERELESDTERTNSWAEISCIAGAAADWLRQCSLYTLSEPLSPA
jgi:hypothetical protein